MASVPGCLSFPVLVRLLSVRTHYDRASARNTSTSPGPRAHTYRRIRTAPRPNLSARARASLRRPRRTKRSSGAHTAGHRSPAMAAPVEHAASPRRAQAKPRPRVRLCLCAAHKRPGDACEGNVRSCEGGGRARALRPRRARVGRTHPGMQMHRSRSEAPQLRADPPPDPSPPRSSQLQQQVIRRAHFIGAPRPPDRGPRSLTCIPMRCAGCSPHGRS